MRRPTHHHRLSSCAVAQMLSLAVALGACGGESGVPAPPLGEAGSPSGVQSSGAGGEAGGAGGASTWTTTTTGGAGGASSATTTASTAESGGSGGGMEALDGGSACSPPAATGVSPAPPVCGDGLRDPETEECDHGTGNGLGTCGASCDVSDVVLTPPGATSGPKMTFGGQPHPVAAGDWGFAAGFAVGSSPPKELDVAIFDTLGRLKDTRVVSAGSTLYPGGTGVSLAALPCGKYVAAWTDYGGDGDAAGVALRLVDPDVMMAGPPEHANESADFNQVLLDMIWTGSELVVAWFDDAALGGMGDIKIRTFDANLSPTSSDLPLASTAATETSAVLTPLVGGWAAAWLAFQDASVSVEAKAGSTTWSTGPLGAGAVVDRPAIVALDDTHLLLVYAVSSSTTDPVQLQAAILDTATPGSVVPFAILPSASGALGADAGDPSLTRVGERVYLSWRSTMGAFLNLPGDVWLKELSVGPTPGIVDTSLPEIPLPRSPEHRTGAQDAPVLALVQPGMSQNLVAAWQDHGTSGSSRILIESMPTPILRKDAP